MIQLRKISDKLFISEDLSVDLGASREKFLCFVSYKPSSATRLLLKDVFGKDGAVVIVSAPKGSAWSDNRTFVEQISSDAGVILALVKFDKKVLPSVDAKLIAVKSGSRWQVREKCILRTEFGKAGITVPPGAFVELDASGDIVRIGSTQNNPISVDGLNLYGFDQPVTFEVTLAFNFNQLQLGPGQLKFNVDIPVRNYNGKHAMLALQYFQAKQDALFGNFKFDRIQYPIFSTPSGDESKFFFQFDVSLDLKEPLASGLPQVMFRSTVKIKGLIRKGQALASLPTNFFTPDGRRLEAMASTIGNLAFHYVAVPTRWQSGHANRGVRYSGRCHRDWSNQGVSRHCRSGLEGVGRCA